MPVSNGWEKCANNCHDIFCMPAAPMSSLELSRTAQASLRKTLNFFTQAGICKIDSPASKIYSGVSR